MSKNRADGRVHVAILYLDIWMIIVAILYLEYLNDNHGGCVYMKWFLGARIIEDWEGDSLWSAINSSVAPTSHHLTLIQPNKCIIFLSCSSS